MSIEICVICEICGKKSLSYIIEEQNLFNFSITEIQQFITLSILSISMLFSNPIYADSSAHASPPAA